MDSSVVSNPKFASQCLIVLFSACPHPSMSPHRCPLPRLDGDAPAPAAMVRHMLLLFLFSRLMATPLQPSPFMLMPVTTHHHHQRQYVTSFLFLFFTPDSDTPVPPPSMQRGHTAPAPTVSCDFFFLFHASAPVCRPHIPTPLSTTIILD